MKLLIIGHGRHGKDTVAQMISDCTGLKFESSSMSAAKIFIYDKLKDKYGYESFDECYNDRSNHRAEWHNLICDYNKEDKAKLAKNILALNDMYVGMRSNVEIEKCQEDKLFDFIIGVFDPNKPLEPKDSFDINLFEKSDIIIITGDEDRVRENVEFIFTDKKNNSKLKTMKKHKFKKMTVEELQDIRNKYSEKITELVKEFKQKTDLDIISIDNDSFDDDAWNINLPHII